MPLRWRGPREAEAPALWHDRVYVCLLPEPGGYCNLFDADHCVRYGGNYGGEYEVYVPEPETCTLILPPGRKYCAHRPRALLFFVGNGFLPGCLQAE